MLDSLARKYGTDKRTNDPGQNIYHGYTPLYEQFLEGKRYETFNLLEIGIREGWSHLMWREYFPNATIYGLDNLEDIAFYTFDKQSLVDRGIVVDIGDAEDESFLNRIYNGITFDIIIDDASHRTQQQLNSFRILFPKLNPGGLYFIEDLDIYQRNAFLGDFGGMFYGELGLIRK